MHPYQKCIDKVEKEHNKSVEEVVREFYVRGDLGPSVTASELGIPRQAVLHFIRQYDLRTEKHQNTRNISKMK